MAQEQTWDKCDCFDNRGLCPHRNDELMKQFISLVSITGYPKKELDFSLASEINETFCNNCNSFKPTTSNPPKGS